MTMAKKGSRKKASRRKSKKGPRKQSPPRKTTTVEPKLSRRLDDLIRMTKSNARQLSALERRVQVLSETAVPTAAATRAEALQVETLTDRAAWLLGTLDPMSNKPAKKMQPTDNLKNTLGLRDIDIRSLTGSMDIFVRERNPQAGVTKAEVENGKTIRGELKLIQKEIDGNEPSDNDADAAINEAKERF
jgi:hypothetical protein